ncbi:hypothetical protein [Ramlibacter humi]|uniref:Uncharacterized protein n=1 Tax=Ramlibacter humi TaxID=2530451 RepID=A0A4Z0BFQ4_9BURK|nr:hypothetical protein [Ramlibacter humi]TFY98175.1 hypothetical protein EZ216_16360 [Ramlibacter humi]
MTSIRLACALLCCTAFAAAAQERAAAFPDKAASAPFYTPPSAAAPAPTANATNATNAANADVTSRPPTQLLGAGAISTPGSGLENVLNSAAPQAWDKRGAMRKVCPPELENRGGNCVPRASTFLSP